MNHPASAGELLVGLADELDRSAILTWGERNRRDLPWRRTRDRWYVLVSEVMLQQTQVDRVVPKWHEFVSTWPTPAALAASPLSSVLKVWKGLGFPRRARNLHAAATEITSEHGGEVPADLPSLLRLPGVGPYTARAVLVFADEQSHGVVDTNVGRILARWTGRTLSPSQAQAAADALATEHPWAWNQAMFDLGADVCRSKTPQCQRCPATWCRFRDADGAADPAIRSAGVSTSQRRFEGSVRQARGLVLGSLAAGAAPPPVVRERAGLVGDERWAPAVRGLVSDGLVELSIDGQQMALPGDL